MSPMLFCRRPVTFFSGSTWIRRFYILKITMAKYSTEECIKDYEPLFVRDLLKDKVAVITGGGSSIGFTITELFMRHGCDTAIISRNFARLQISAGTLEKATGRNCLPLSADVRKPEELKKAFDRVLERYKKVDIVVNNAAGNFLCPISGMSFNAFRAVMEIDAFGCFNVSKIAFDKYLKDHGGVILNISATLHYTGQVLQAHAGSAKAAIDALTKHMAAELGQYKIRVVGLAPGPIGGTFGYEKLGGEVLSATLREIIPLQRPGTKQEVGRAALFLVSDAATYITGHTLVVDGGAWLSPMNSIAHNEKFFNTVTSKM